MTGIWRTALLILGICAGCAPDEDTSSSARAAAIFDGTVETSTATAVRNANALTLPAQRHLVRIGGTDLLVVQHDGQNGRALGMYRSDDAGRSWRYVGDILNQRPPRMTADLMAVGEDVAVLYSYEGPELFGSTLHDVVFQWWRRDRDADTWLPAAPVRVFDSTSDSTAFYRAEMTRDSLGRIWVVAFFLAADGSTAAQVTVSTDGGATWRRQPDLATVPFRAGGLLLSLGTRMIFLYDGHKTADPTRLRVRDDADPLDRWSAPQAVFPEGIYHGAALSAVRDGRGGMHLLYKDKSAVLWHRAFDGNSFGPRTLIEDVGNWELQPAAARVGDDVIVFYNRVITTNVYDELRMRVLSNGVWSPPRVIDSTVSFKGYPAMAEVLPATTTSVPCVVCVTPVLDQVAEARVYRLSWSNGTPSVDLARPVDLATRPPVDLAPRPPVDLAPPPPLDLAPPPPLDLAPPPPDGGGAALTFRETWRDTAMEILAVAPNGTAFARGLSRGPDRLFASTDGARTWTQRARHPAGSAWKVMAALSDGTLLATVRTTSGDFALSRSTDGGATWRDVLALGQMRMQHARSIAELAGVVYFLEFQTATSSDLPVRLWASTDRGATWSTRFVFTGHSRGNVLSADRATGALWATFGDRTRQMAVARSTDGGRSWATLLRGDAGDVLDATPLPGGELLFGQAISRLPLRPSIARLSPSGGLTVVAPLPGPSYSIQRLSAGGFVVGAAREAGGDLSPPGDTSARLVASPDGARWSEVASFRAADPNADVRADVYFELPSTRELVVQLINAEGFGPGGRGYVLMAPVR
jgi:photosystem II stability/assembly factor-like uncharacterized protein